MRDEIPEDIFEFCTNHKSLAYDPIDIYQGCESLRLSDYRLDGDCLFVPVYIGEYDPDQTVKYPSQEKMNMTYRDPDNKALWECLKCGKWVFSEDDLRRGVHKTISPDFCEECEEVELVNETYTTPKPETAATKTLYTQLKYAESEAQIALDQIEAAERELEKAEARYEKEVKAIVELKIAIRDLECPQYREIPR